VYTWGSYQPSIVEFAMMAWSFAFVSMNMLLFARFFPLIPLFESKEAMIFTTEMKIGRTTIPAVLREQE